MAFRPFKLERYLARWEFSARHFLSASDCESMTVGELLELGDQPVDALLDQHLGYTESEGDPLLRERIGSLCEIEPDQVLVTNAPEEGIFLTMAALVRPGDRVLVQSPCYQSLFELARHNGGDVECWPLVEGESEWSWDLARLEWLLERRTRLVVVNVPHNPTGFQPSPSEFEALMGLCERHGAWLFVDQMYRGLEGSSAARLPFLPSEFPKVISLWGMSKSFGLPGLRSGWLATRNPDLLESLLEIKDYTSICCSAPSMLLARLALEQAETLMERNRGIIADNTSLVEQFMASPQEILSWLPPMAGPVALAHLLDGSASEFCTAVREQRDVLMIPSPIFEWGDSHIRLGLGRNSFGAGLEALAGFLPAGSFR